ncbi:metal ABC transporter solute-binding protein, Zn/Mn family [Neorhizobium alkalisoli]|uniref:Substrate-binding protein of zinc uptake complex component A n=1 Tax=Neorhizobium alkalisoli TaxID=528178 RepID=A0A561Q852_9HYPH|nr:zinc ABC transporter substrate-binding protein [Neorhizobium alkalisoli]TWF46529.1 substrate-binding protein of zinc uptake complex component A [Neorhizobium alkalisoli]
MSPYLKRRLVIAAAFAIPAGKVFAQVKQGGSADMPVTILTAHPAAFALAATLAKGSLIVTKTVQPERLPASRLASFLAGRGKAALESAAADADAVITFRSFWPEDPLYPHARRANIRLIEIDAARPIDGRLPGIAIADPTDDRVIYDALMLTPMSPSGEAMAPWLSPTVMGRMADIIAADLCRLVPSAAASITSNCATLKQRLFAIRADIELALAGADNLTALALSPHFQYLAQDLSIELLGSITAAPNEWTPERCGKLVAWLRDHDVKVVLLDADPGDDLQDAIRNAGSTPAVLSTIGEKLDDPLSFVDFNMSVIARAFAG